MSTVLVVEDSATQRKMIASILQESGLKVKVANDGAEALKLLQTSFPDLVVVDVVMPKMNGYELCRQLKADPKTKNLPVVMCSLKNEEHDRYWAMKQGANAYIAKPFNPTDLIATINYLLAG